MPTTKKTFSKSPSNPSNILSKLKSQNLIIASTQDEQEALIYLSFIGGYRLKGYYYHLLNASKQFPSPYQFKDIIDRYEFDKELRSLTISAVDILEVALRVTMSNTLSLKHGSHWYLDTSLFKSINKWTFGQQLSKIESETIRAEKRRFVNHYFAQYDDPYLPPSWVVSECVTFGLWSRTYSILKDPHDKKSISMKFGIDKTDVFQSWIHAIYVMRNIAAHNGRILRNKFDVAPANNKGLNIKFNDNKSFYAVATVINYLLVQTKLKQKWKDELIDLFARYPSIDKNEIGFSINWQTKPGW